jgi:HlyD family secretion protein
MDSDLQKLRLDKSQKAPKGGGKSWPWFLVILLLAGAALGVWQYRKTSGPRVVEVLRIRAPGSEPRASDAVLLTSTGYIMAAHRIELASKVIGRVAWVGVEMGDRVKKDQVLVRLEDDEYKARVVQEQGQLESSKARLAELKAGNRPQEIAQAAANVQAAQVDFDKAQRNFTRLKALNDASALSITERDDAESAAQAGAARLESARQQYELLKVGSREEVIAAQEAVVKQLEGVLATAALDLANTVIRAPVDATILARNVEVGEFVTTGFVGERGAKGYVVSLADLNDLLVELDIVQSDFAKVSFKQPCRITTDAYPDRPYDGVVQLISPVANRQKATVEVRVKITSPDDLLKPDMNATVSFLNPAQLAATRAAASSSSTATTPSAPAPITIPASALRADAVFIVQDGKAARRPVTTAPSTTPGQLEITSGLTGGEDLILNPPPTLQDGDKVQVK